MPQSSKQPSPKLFARFDRFLKYAGFLSAHETIEKVNGVRKPVEVGVPLTWNTSGSVLVVYDAFGHAWIAHPHFVTRDQTWWNSVCDNFDLKQSARAYVPYADDRAAIQFFLERGRKLLEPVG